MREDDARWAYAANVVTTLLLHMAWALASSLLTGQPEPARSRLGLMIKPLELPLPLFVPLA
jgi:hypothetical protein